MVLIFIFGLVFGSFLNVVIYRLRNGRNMISDRSSCPECQSQLKWFDLIPLFSFLYLRGHCRYCHKKISWQYPIVEILSGLIWVGVFYKVFGLQPPFIPPLSGGGVWAVFNFFFLSPLDKGGFGGVLSYFYYIFIFSAFLIIAVYDFRWKIIPDKIVYPAIAVALIYNAPPLISSLIREEDYGGFLIYLFSAILAFLFFFSFFYFSKGKAMGFGDAKLAFLIGLFLGQRLAITALVLSFIIGAVFGIILLWSRRRTLKSQIAFGPFMVIGAVIAFFFSNFISKFFVF